MNVDAAVACAYSATDGIVRLGDLVRAAGIKVRRKPPWRGGHPVFKLAAELADRGVVKRGPSNGEPWRTIEYHVVAMAGEAVAA